MRKNLNRVRVEGYVYEHNLAIKQVQNKESKNFGQDFIGGELSIAVDELGLNILTVHYTYVTPTTSTGKANSTYTILKKIIEDKIAIQDEAGNMIQKSRTWIEAGKANAFRVRADSAIALNDFYSQDDRQVSAKRIEGGFLTMITDDLVEEESRNTFQVDMLISSAKRVDADPEKYIENDYVDLGGYAFNFRNDILPINLMVTNPDGMKFFEDMDASPAQPVYLKVWGRINCTTVETERVEESAFGKAAVTSFKRQNREWIVTGAATVPYDFGDESVMTADEVVKALQDREVRWAEIKKRNEDYRASQSAGGTGINFGASTQTAAPTPSTAPSVGFGSGFKF